MEISRQTHGLFVGNAHYENDLTETTSSNVDLLNNDLTPRRIHLKPYDVSVFFLCHHQILIDDDRIII